jgi:hypothetical protein
MNYDLTAQRKFERFLEPGEKLLWSGRPATGLRLRPSDAVRIPFGLFFCGAVVHMVSTTSASGGWQFFHLWALFFAAIALYLVVGRFFVDAHRRSTMLYGLTDRRALIVSGAMSQTVSSVYLSTIEDATLSERASGEGSIRLTWPASRYWLSDGGLWVGGADRGYSFEFIRNPAQVYSLIQRAKSDAAQATA